MYEALSFWLLVGVLAALLAAVLASVLAAVLAALLAALLASLCSPGAQCRRWHPPSYMTKKKQKTSILGHDTYMSHVSR
jgi:heme A synthase